MPKNRKRRSKKRHKRRALRDARGRRWTRDQELVRCFAQDVKLTPMERRIASAATPPMSSFHTSHWLEGGIDRAMARTGCDAAQVIDVLERMQRWAHGAEWASQQDVAFQLCGLEMLRRLHGAEPRVIELPEPLRPLELARDELLGAIAGWEATSYASCVLQPSDGDADATRLFGASFLVAGHLAKTDGVPIRLERLDASSFAVELMEEDPKLGPPPAGWVPHMLTWAATLYDRFVDIGRLERAVSADISTQLRSLAMATAGTGATHAA